MGSSDEVMTDILNVRGRRYRVVLSADKFEQLDALLARYASVARLKTSRRPRSPRAEQPKD